jgi:signal transduction histidine kinase
MIPRDALRGSVLARSALPLLAVGGPLVAFAVLLYERDLATERRLHEHDGLAVADLHARMISREATVVESDLMYLLRQRSLEEFLDGRPGSQERLESEYLAFSGLKKLYDQIRVIDAGGREVVRINYNGGRPAVVPERELQPKAARFYFQETIGLQPGEIYVSPLDLNVEHDRIEQPLKPMIRFAAPLFDDTGARRGIVVLNYLGERLLETLADTSASHHGVLLLLNRAGHYLRGSRPEDEWGFMLGHDRTFGKDHPQAWRRITGEERGQFVDAEGLFTFRSIRLGRVPADALTIVAWVPRGMMRRATDQFRNRTLLAGAALFPPLFAASWYVSYASFLRRSHERQLAESEARLRKLSLELLRAQERERSALSRDLHDGLGQLVTSITLDLERAQQVRSDERDRTVDRALAGARLLLERIHEITSRVRPRILDELGLRDAVRSYLAEFEDRTGIAVSAELKFAERPIPRLLSENVYRILQEALTNVAKHARSPTVRVLLRVNDEQLSLSVSDRGVGFDPQASTAGFGLLGMRERAELLGGRHAVRSRPGAGTEVEVLLPIGGQGDDDAA